MQQLDQWLLPDWQQFETRMAANRLPHALLIAGSEGCGKLQLAQKIIRHLICSNNNSACGQCSSCNLLAAGTHPDYLEVVPEAAGKQIKIDAVRKVLEFSSTTAQMDGNKVIFLAPAENMNINSANALLKCLEEPNPGSFLVLLAERTSALLPTIRSRCQVVEVSRPTLAEAKQWIENQGADDWSADQLDLALALSADAPYTALETLKNGSLQRRSDFFEQLRSMLNKQLGVVELAEKWHKNSLLEISAWILSLLQDVLKVGMSGNEKVIVNNDLSGFVNVLSKRMSSQVLNSLVDDVLLIRQQLLSGQANPNTQMLLEKHLCGWLDMK